MGQEQILAGLVHLWAMSGQEYRKKLEQAVKANHPNIAERFFKEISKKGKRSWIGCS